MTKSSVSKASCPCGGAAFAQCCAPFIEGGVAAPDAEKLMRSRYTAFTLEHEAYLLATWHVSTRPQGQLFAGQEKTQWLGLEVKSDLRLRKRKADAMQPDSAGPGAAPPDGDGRQWDSVEFIARYKINGRAQRLHEISRFVCEQEAQGPRWYYVDGSFPQSLHER